MKKVIFFLSAMLIVLVVGLHSVECFATDGYVDLYVDCGDGSCHTADGFDTIWGNNRAKIGSTVASCFNFDEDPTAIDQDFVGWYAYNKETGAQLGGLLTTSEVVNYVIPNHNIKFVAQWTPRAGYPVTCHTEAVLYNDRCEPCTDVKVSLIFGDTCYSGYGFVTIPESVYSAWSRFTYRLEPMNGAYIMYDGKWVNEVCEWEGTVKEIKRHGSSYTTANYTGTGRDTTFSRRPVNDFFYEASFVAPEISVISKAAAEDVISDISVVPVTYSVVTEVYQSGASYDSAVNAAQSTCGTSNVMVADINLIDDRGVKVSQLSDYVDVKVDIPATYTIQPGNTVVVYYLNDTGILEECETVYHDEDPDHRYVIFKTNHFSIYVLVETMPKPEVTPEPEVTSEPEGAPESEVAPGDVPSLDELKETNVGNSADGEETTEGKESTETEEANAEESFAENETVKDAEKSDAANNPIVWVAVFAAMIIVIIIIVYLQKKK